MSVCYILKFVKRLHKKTPNSCEALPCILSTLCKEFSVNVITLHSKKRYKLFPDFLDSGLIIYR